MPPLTSALGAFVKTSGAVLDSILTASRSVLARSAKVGSDMAAQGAAMARRVRDNFDEFMTSVRTAANKADDIATSKTGKAPLNDMPPSGLARVTKQSDTLSKYGITPTTVFAGITALTLASLALARLDGTDGVKVSITDIKILSADKVQITYTSAGRNFNPCVNDTFTFYPPPNPDATPTSPDLSIGGDKTVVQVIDDNTIVIQAALTRAGTSVYPSPAPATSPSSSTLAPAPVIAWGKMTCHSDYDNQLGASIGEAVAFVAGAAAAAIVETGTALTPAAAQVLGAAAGGAAAVLGAGVDALTPLANDIFGPIFEFFEKFKWIIIAICVILCGGLAAMLVLS